MTTEAVVSPRIGIFSRTWQSGLLAGIAGGATEIVWILFYSQLTGSDASAVASGVTNSLLPGLAGSSMVVPLGIIVHMFLAALLGVTIAALLRSVTPGIRGTLTESVVVMSILAAVWATNYFMILPIINPAFIGTVPHGIALVSKVLFGMAAASVLHLRKDKSLRPE